jgi:hypothetical protein
MVDAVSNKMSRMDLETFAARIRKAPETEHNDTEKQKYQHRIQA